MAQHNTITPKSHGKTIGKIITVGGAGLVAAASLTLQACGTHTTALGADQLTIPAQPRPVATSSATPIKHVVVIFGENISFDHYFGTYPNATNADGMPFRAKPGTPPVNGLNTVVKGGGTLLTNNPNGTNPRRFSPTDINDLLTCDQNHGYTAEQAAFDGGKMDEFLNDVGTATGTTPAGQPCKASDVLNYYDGNTVTALWNYAQQYALSDNSHGDVYGPSTPGAMSIATGSTGGIDQTAGAPKIATSPDNARAAQLVPDGKGKYTQISDNDPYYDDCGAGTHTGVSGSGHTIGDLLNNKGLSWGWFQGGFAPTTAYSGPPQKGSAYDPTTVTGRAVCGSTHPIGAAIGGTGQYGTIADYIPHHEPFQYFESTANPHHLAPTSLAAVGTDTQHYTNGKPDFDTANHQYDLSTFDNLVAAITAGKLSPDHLPAVSYLKAPGYEDAHALISDPLDEQQFLVKEVNALEQSPDWSSTAIVLAYDDSDGWYDHVMAPVSNPSITVADVLDGQGRCLAANRANTGTTPLAGEQGRCGPGPRLPLLIISPFAKQNFVDHHKSQQGSVVKFIEDNWRLGRIPGSTDAIAGSLDSMFNFQSRDRNERLILNPKTGAKIN